MGNPFDRDYFDRDNIINLEPIHVRNMPGTENMPHMPQETNYDLELSLPGFTRDEITLEIDESRQILNIVAEKPKQSELREMPYYIRREYTLESLTNYFNAPPNFKVSDIQADYEVGLLRLRFPHQEEQRGAA